jgi:L-fuculose-phosphate aldolase
VKYSGIAALAAPGAETNIDKARTNHARRRMASTYQFSEPCTDAAARGVRGYAYGGVDGSACEDLVMPDPFTLEDRVNLAEAARDVAAGGLVVGASGNLGIRRDDHLLITPRGSHLGAIDPADCVSVTLVDGSVSPDHARPSRPSSELPLHLAVYAAAPEAKAIVHTHSHFATVLSTLVDEIPAIHYVTTEFGGPLRVAPYATFGSVELAEGVATALAGRSAALMANHGAVTIAMTLDRAVEQARQLEWLASVYWHAQVFGTPTLLDKTQLGAVDVQTRTLGKP